MNKLLYISLLSSLCAFSTVHAAAVEKPEQPAVKESRATYDLNTIDLKQLKHAFHGIGKRRAEAILAYREAHGGFSSVAELAKVKGVGNSFVKKNLEELEKTFKIKAVQ